jgi:hypothetical protein
MKKQEQAPKSPWPRADYVERASRRAELHTEGIRGMFILNGGGVLALLTFLTQIVQTDAGTKDIIRYTIVSIGFLLLGLIVLAPINHLRYESSRLFDHVETKPKGQKYGLAHRILFILSMILFALGVFTALIGVWVWKA